MIGILRRLIHYLVLQVLFAIKPNNYSCTIYKIRVYGEKDFVQCIREALFLLRAGSSHFNLIRRNVHVIKQGWSSCIRVHKTTPTIFLKKETCLQETVISVAGGIAHEACHNILYNRFITQKWWKRFVGDFYNRAIMSFCDRREMLKKEEKKCIQFQIRVLKELHADSILIDYLRSLMTDPAYAGYGTIFDYWLRGW